MTEATPSRKIASIKNGVVIDHIRKGRGLLIAQLLKLDQIAEERNTQISIGLNHKSKLGLKDFIKVENFELSEAQLSCVALVSPDATINTIRDTQVVAKRSAQIPDLIGDLVRCPDPFCITNHEQVKCRFSVLRREPITLLCHFCETEFYDKLIHFKL